MVVEFVGIPGCGKSTVARALQERCTDEGKIVTMYRNPLKSGIIFKLCQSMYIVLISLFEKESRSILKKIVKIQIHLLQMNGIRAYRSLPFLFKILLIFRSCIIEGKNNMIIIEQGIFQYILAALYRMQYSKKVIRDFVSGNILISKDWYVVFCDIEIDEDMNRLKHRKNGRSRIEKCPQSQWMQEIEDQMKRYEDVKKMCLFTFEKNIHLSTTDVPPDENALIICKKIAI